jgi:hypothetical protein
MGATGAEISSVCSALDKSVESGTEGLAELLVMIWRARRPLTTRLSFDFLSSKVCTSDGQFSKAAVAVAGYYVEWL